MYMGVAKKLGVREDTPFWGYIIVFFNKFFDNCGGVST
jgi:hypothetical protein